MKSLIWVHLGILVPSVLTLCAINPVWALSLGLGGLVALANIALLVYVWRGIFRKKNIALGIGLIVFKYAFLVLIVLGVAISSTMDLVWFGAGLAVLIVSVPVWAFFLRGSRRDPSQVPTLFED